MSTDLSHLLNPDPISALCPTSQAAFSQSGNNAHTAPGTVPAAPHSDNPAPVVEAINHGHNEETLRDGHDTGLDGGRPMLVTGSWNNFGGGPAPKGYRNA